MNHHNHNNNSTRNNNNLNTSSINCNRNRILIIIMTVVCGYGLSSLSLSPSRVVRVVANAATIQRKRVPNTGFLVEALTSLSTRTRSPRQSTFTLSSSTTPTTSTSTLMRMSMSMSTSTVSSSSSSATTLLPTKHKQKQQQQQQQPTITLPRKSSISPAIASTKVEFDIPLLNLHTITYEELTELIVSWGYPKYRSKQIYDDWIRGKGVTNPNEMITLPKKLRQTLIEFTSIKTSTAATTSDDEEEDAAAATSLYYDNSGGGSLQLEYEDISKDGTRKRAYKLRDGQLIESVLMGPYQDGHYTACISSQAGCAMGCIFCATGQMGFARQLTSDEIFEQVSRFSNELKRESHQNLNSNSNSNNLNVDNNSSNDNKNKGGNKKGTGGKGKRLSNVVFMGMGEPLANYRNVVKAVNRINTDLGIGSRKITVSTVGVVPNIRKLFAPDTEMPQIRLAVSLHCSNDKERSQLLPANDRYGGLHELMTCLKEYIETTGRRITFEWALIANENDTIAQAKQLGNLIKHQYKLRTDMVHINVIPLNPTVGFGEGKPSNTKRVNAFCNCLINDFQIQTTPRVRRGIDINAGCGQLKAKIQKKELDKLEQQQLWDRKENNKNNEEPPPNQLADFVTTTTIPAQQSQPLVGVYDYDDCDDNDDNTDEEDFFRDISSSSNSVVDTATDTDTDTDPSTTTTSDVTSDVNNNKQKEVVDFTLDANVVDFERDDFINPEYAENSEEMHEVDRLMALVDKGAFAATTTTTTTTKKSMSMSSSSTLVSELEAHQQQKESSSSSSSSSTKTTTTIIDEDAVRQAKKKRKKLLRNLKQIRKLKEMNDLQLNKEQLVKISREEEWILQVESLEHNLK